MILSSTFSRQNRSHQSWTNGHLHHSPQQQTYHHQHGGSLRKPPPQQPAPEQPKVVLSQHKSGAQVNGLHNPVEIKKRAPNNMNINRSQTLSRLEMNNNNRNRLQKSSLQRNLSSLGHYPATTNTNHLNRGGLNLPNKQPLSNQIYAPASIASPTELAHYKQPATYHPDKPMNGESQHYAATSCIVPSVAASESGRSGRESALSNLFERFGGTLRRKTAKWPRLSPRKNHGRSESPASFSSSIGNGKQPNGSSLVPNSTALPNSTNIPPLLPPPITLDPEIYASGKKKVEAEEIYAEGLHAIDGNIQKRLIEYELNESLMLEGESRTIVTEESKHKVEYQRLISSLTNWINDELSQQRIIVKDLQDDLFDGQILGKLIEKLHQIKLDIVEVTQNETIQRYKLQTVLETINRILTLQARWAKIKWTVDGIHGKNVVEIIYLLITLAIYYRAPIKLPNNVTIQILVVQKRQGQLTKRSQEVQLTNPSQAPDFDCRNGYVAIDYKSQNEQRDAFDTLVEFAPEKLAIVKQSLVNFANRHLNKINMSCLARNDDQLMLNNSSKPDILDPEQFSDGLLLVFLISSLEDYFVPLGNLFTSPVGLGQHELDTTISSGSNNQAQMLQTAIQPNSYINTLPIHKLHNVNIAFQLMEEAGIGIRQKVRAEDVANGDLKSVLRVLYALFSRYKHI